MAQLGSVFDGDEGEGPRGPDLRVTVEVPRAALGASFRAPVPRSLAADGDLVERALPPGEDADTIEFHLPEDLEPRSALLLRGQGGVSPDPEGRPGDLTILLELVDRPPRDGERITHAPEALVQAQSAGPTVDMTWWILLALALVGGGIVTAFALL